MTKKYKNGLGAPRNDKKIKRGLRETNESVGGEAGNYTDYNNQYYGSITCISSCAFGAGDKGLGCFRFLNSRII